MLLSKYPKSIIKELKALYKEFNRLVIKNNQDKNGDDIKNLKNQFSLLTIEPNISIISLLLLKNNLKIKNIQKYNKVFLITELYLIGFTLHLNIENPKFQQSHNKESPFSDKENIKTLQVLLGDFLFTKIFEIILSLDNKNILELFAKYNKKISEGMLELKQLSSSNDIEKIIDTYKDIYGSFFKLCFESIIILSREDTQNNSDNIKLISEIEAISCYIESFFSVINIYKNIYVYNFASESIELDKLKEYLINEIYNIESHIIQNKYTKDLTNYLNNIIIRIKI